MQRWRGLLILVLILAACGAAAAKTFRTLPGDAHNLVQFVSDATLEKVVGRTSNIHGTVALQLDSLLSTTKAEFRVDLRTIDTGIALRNQHMRENHLETAKYPIAVFTLKHFISADKDALEHVLAEGELALHGVTRSYQIPLTLAYTRNGNDGGMLTVKGEWTVKLADHQINRPSFLFLRLAEEIRITVNVTLSDAPVIIDE